jgi:hypothetical protein
VLGTLFSKVYTIQLYQLSEMPVACACERKQYAGIRRQTMQFYLVLYALTVNKSYLFIPGNSVRVVSWLFFVRYILVGHCLVRCILLAIEDK